VTSYNIRAEDTFSIAESLPVAASDRANEEAGDPLRAVQ
jgi:hypothetical protein